MEGCWPAGGKPCVAAVADMHAPTVKDPDVGFSPTQLAAAIVGVDDVWEAGAGVRV